jgi:diacylglycerol O-acyltransferase / wax synthase
VPVSVRSNDAADKTDNRVSVMLPYLPVEKADPVEQLQAVHRRLTRVKGSGQRQAGSVFVSAANVIPFPLTAWTVRALTRLPQRGVVTLATNVPGPRKRLHIMGREVIRLLPIPPIALQLRTGIAILSYADHLVFGIATDYDAAPDVDELASGIKRAVARLVTISTALGAPHPWGRSNWWRVREQPCLSAKTLRSSTASSVWSYRKRCGWAVAFSPRTLCLRCIR